MKPAATARPIDHQASGTWRTRGTAFAVAATCGAVLGLAAFVEPDARGYGTHERLGLPPCGFLVGTGLPCPTCGMTSSFALMMHAHPLDAVVAQPAGAILCLATLATMFVAMRVVVSGRMPLIRWEMINPVHVMVTIGVLFMGAWGVKLALGLLSGNLPAS